MKLAPCPDCKNLCSLTATSCPRCGRNMQPGDLSEANLVKSTDYSKISNTLIHILAAIIGLIVFIFYFAFLSFLPKGTDSALVLGLVAFSFLSIIFFALALLFGFTWNTLEWRLGISLVSVPIIIFLLASLFALIGGSFLYSSLLLLCCLTIVAAGYFGTKLGASYKEKLQQK